MKCVRNVETGRIRRVNELEALRLVLGDDDGEWSYVAKKAWKAQERAGATSESTMNEQFQQSQTRTDEPNGSCGEGDRS